MPDHKNLTPFDLFTIRVTGCIYNGDERQVDESGGLLGRHNERLRLLERQRWLIIGLLLLALANGAITNVGKITGFLEKLF